MTMKHISQIIKENPKYNYTSLPDFIKKLQQIEKDIITVGGDPNKSKMSIETVDNERMFYYEEVFDLFVDDNNNIGMSPVHR